MKNSIFTLTDLECGYSKNHPVLKIQNLTIYKNEITFIIGKSGSGKSTLLETLGFMNQTISGSKSNQAVYRDHNNDKNISIQKLWSEDRSAHARFRNEQYSFIFQENNLLEHFTACENIILPMMLNGESEIAAREKAENAFKKIHLATELMDKNIKYLSGGQRQRISFLRALLTHKPVLFGDEPTGNLDPITARALMSMIQEETIKFNNSAIIVSHDISLAIEYAQRIVLLKVNKDQYGEVDKILFKENDKWIDEDTQQQCFEQKIIEML